MAKYQVTQIEKRKRGLFGWVVAILFYGFNAAMILMMVLTWIPSLPTSLRHRPPLELL